MDPPHTTAGTHWYYTAPILPESFLYATPQGTTTHTDHQVATPTNRYTLVLHDSLEPANHIQQAIKLYRS